MLRGLARAWRIAPGVISWNAIRWVGTLGFRTSVRCQAMASPSRSSSVARYSSDASLVACRSLATTLRRSVGTMYRGSKLLSTSTPQSLAQDWSRYFAGIWLARLGRSRMCPWQDSTR